MLGCLFEVIILFLMQAFIAIYFHLRTAIAASHMFWCIMFPFLFFSEYFLISLLSSSVMHWFFRVCCLLSIYCEFSNFPPVTDL